MGRVQMIKYVYGNDLGKISKLAQGMFRDRTAQFRDRLDWDVSVSRDGFEMDEYDRLNPQYVIMTDASGQHRGSMRFLPTTGRTMVNEHFTDILGGGALVSPLIWECTLFCLAPNAEPTVAAGLMLAAGEILQGFDIKHFVGVFDEPMLRVYKALGASPEVLGTLSGTSVGLWEFNEKCQDRLARRSGISIGESRAMFNAAFDQKIEFAAQ